MKQKRLAIQISGHLRTFKETIPSFKKYIIKPNEQDGWEIDVFIHTWDQTDHNDVVHHNKTGEMRGIPLTQDNIKLIHTEYAPLDIETSPQLKVDDQRVFKKHNGDEVSFSIIKNVYYTKFQANKLRQKHESNTGCQYDYVLCTRADIEFYSPFNLNQYINEFNVKLGLIDNTNQKLFFSGGYSSSLIKSETLLAGSDILYFGNPFVIDTVCEIYNNLNSKSFEKEFTSFEHYKVLYARNKGVEPIQIGYKRFKDWQILRAKEQRKWNEFRKLKSLLRHRHPM